MKPDDQIQNIVKAAGLHRQDQSVPVNREATNEFLLFRYYLGYKTWFFTKVV
jgi:hypothetical protein